MNRVQTAITEGRCVLAVGGRALKSQDVLGELRRRGNLPIVALGGDATNPAVALSEAAIAPALGQQGGVLVLVEPDAATDGRALSELAELVKKAGHKPRLYVAARAFNPFAMPMNMRLLKLEQIKSRAQDFLSSLPIPTGPVVVAPSVQEVKKAARKKESSNAPRPIFVGREEEVEALGAMLDGDGGPVVITGVSGVGRHWLLEHTLSQRSLKRLPTFVCGRGRGADQLLALLALVAKEAGDDRLHNAVTGKEGTAPAALAALVAETVAGEAFNDTVLVIDELQRVLVRRDGSFYRLGRIELLLRALLTCTPAGRIVFISELAPTFYREGEATGLRVLPLEGIQGKELHALFAACHAPDFPRDRFGPISERIHGHGLAARTYAIAARDAEDVEDLLERPKFLAAPSIGHHKALGKHLAKKVEKLPDDLRKALAGIALLTQPGTPVDLQALGINRATRLKLITAGLLDQTPGDDGRRYSVHPLVQNHLTWREIEDFGRMEELGNHLLDRSRGARKDGDKATSLALAYEANRLLVSARRARSRMKLPYADTDALVEEIRGILRRKNARVDIARMRTSETLKLTRANPELLLIDAEVKRAENAGVEAIEAAYLRAETEAPTPEVFHTHAGWHMSRNARGKAAGALERGIAAYPESGPLYRRLAGVYMHQNKHPEAVELLRKAMEVEPMMPDSYAMLGEALLATGAEHLEEAETLTAEALRLAPEHPLHQARRGNLLRKKSMLDPENAAELLAEAEASTRAAMATEKNNSRILTLLGTILLDRDGGDLEQVQWLLKQAAKRGETPDIFIQRARLLARQGQPAESERLLERAINKAPSHHEAFAAKAELALINGNPFLSLDHLKVAKERSPKNAPERARYEREMAKMQVLIESGAAAEMMKAAEASAEEVPPVTGPTGEEGPRREAGSAVIRRRKGEQVDVTEPADGDPVQAAEAGAEESAPAAEE